MSEDRSPSNENHQEPGMDEEDVEAQRLMKATDEPDGNDDDVEAHRLI